MQVVAAIVGLVGLGLIFAPEFKTLPTAGIAVAYGVLATFSFCIGNLLSSDSQRGVPVLASTSWGMVYGMLFMAIIAFCAAILHHRHVAKLSVQPRLAILISSVMTFACYLSLVGRIGPGRAAATVVFPVFALLISARYEWI